jgi:2,3-bisphosphoglycerate-independent phosphoglycerate mutase
VGHLNIGAGRVVYQELTRINLAIRDGSFFANPVLNQAVDTAKQNGGALHLMGLLSDGGVHSHQDHIFAMMRMAVEKGVKHVYVHAFLDGRDTPPRSASAFIAALQAQCDQLGGTARVASISGRYYSMDRDKRWERTQAGYDLITQGKAGFSASTATAALEAAYARGENDEFVQPTVVGEPVAMADGDAVLYMNFRADRARQMCQALMLPDFSGFKRACQPRLGGLFTLTSYSDDFSFPVAYPPQKVRNGFGEYIAGLGLRQLRIAETEKYAHVTFFFNGGEEQTYPGEERILVQSPKVATYDLQPEMSAPEVTDRLVEAIRSRKFDAIICNYANGDMVGHTGILPAAIKAVETLDQCVGRVVAAMQEIGGEVLITADHGNCEMMADPATHQAHTAHTMGPVPFLYVGRPAQMVEGGALQDVAPTLLRMMGLPQPAEMTGKSLIRFA